MEQVDCFRQNIVIWIFISSMSYRLYFLFLVLLSEGCGLINQARGNRELVSAPHEPPARLITALPFRQLTGGVLIVQAQIDTFPDTLNFILDTGSGGISLDSSTCRRLHLQTVLSDQFIRGIGGIRRLSFAYNNTLVLPNMRVDSLDFHVMNYSFISSVYGIRIDGIIGYSLMKDYILKIDYDQKKIFIFTPGRYVYEKGGWLFHPLLRQIPVFPALINNKTGPIHKRYYFDVGAGLCLMLSDQFVKDSGLFESPKQRRHKFIPTETQGFAGAMMMTETVIGKVQLGPYKFKKVPVYLFDDVSNVTSYPLLGGLVGNDLLRRFNTTLNYPQGEIYLRPNEQFKEPFDYSYTGLTLYFIDGRVVITRVLPDSPASKAGLRENDIIVAISGNFSNDISIYHKLLKGPGKVVELLILRDGAPMQVRLKVKSIL